jgi:hypothetical protein
MQTSEPDKNLPEGLTPPPSPGTAPGIPPAATPMALGTKIFIVIVILTLLASGIFVLVQLNSLIAKTASLHNITSNGSTLNPQVPISGTQSPGPFATAAPACRWGYVPGSDGQCYPSCEEGNHCTKTDDFCCGTNCCLAGSVCSQGNCCPVSYPYYYNGLCHTPAAGSGSGSSGFSGSTGSTCSPGSAIFDTSAGHCCPEGYTHYYGGTCHQCSEGYSIYTTSAGHCCPEGYTYSYNGGCYACAEGYSKYTTSAGHCCPEGYTYYYDGMCNACAQGYSKYTTSAGHCCPEGYGYFYNGQCYTQPQGGGGGGGGSSQIYWVGCTECPNGQVYSYRGYDYGACNGRYQMCVAARCGNIKDNCR